MFKPPVLSGELPNWGIKQQFLNEINTFVCPTHTKNGRDSEFLVIVVGWWKKHHAKVQVHSCYGSRDTSADKWNSGIAQSAWSLSQILSHNIIIIFSTFVAWSPITSKAPLCQHMRYGHRSRYWHRSSWILALIKVREARGHLHVLMAKSSYLTRPILAIPHQLSTQGLAVTQSWSWRWSSSVFGPSEFWNQAARPFQSAAE